MQVMRVRARRATTDRVALKETKMVKACAAILPGRHPSEVVQYLRIGEGLTVAAVAQFLGVSVVTVRRWQPPSLFGFKQRTHAARLAEMRNLTLAWKKRKQKDGER